MTERLTLLLISVAIIINFTSCSLVNQLIDAVSSFIGSTEINDINRHDYTAEEYVIPTQIGDFKSLERTQYLCYKNLTEPQKQAYDYMYNSAMRMDNALFYVGECTADDVAVAFHSLVYDCPYLIWMPSSYGVSEQSGATFVRFVDPEGSYSYTMSPEQRDLCMDELYKEIDMFVSQNILPTMTPYEIELAVHDWICNKTTYNDKAADSLFTDSFDEYFNAWTPYGAIVQGSAVCAGYSKSVQMVLNYLGVECCSLRVTSRGEMHMLCVVNLDGDWVYLDPTWNDKEACGLPFTHDYFNLSYDEIVTTHNVFESYDLVVKNGKELDSNFNVFVPKDNVKDYNYYKMNALQINSEAEFKQKVVGGFTNAVQRGLTSLEFQLTYCQPTNEMLDKLIDDYDIINSISRRTKNISSVQYAALNNGAFCMKINFKD